MKDNGSNSKDEILSEVRMVLDEPYTKAKQTHIWAEEATGEHNWMAMMHFRDALDHLSKILIQLEDDEFEEAKQNQTEMRAHIYRAMYDSAQIPVDRELSTVLENRLPVFLYKITLLDHMSEQEYNERLDLIKEEMTRTKSSISDIMDNDSLDFEPITRFRKAYQHANEINEGTPPKMVVYFRLFLILLFTLALGTGIIFIFG